MVNPHISDLEVIERKIQQLRIEPHQLGTNHPNALKLRKLRKARIDIIYLKTCSRGIVYGGTSSPTHATTSIFDVDLIESLPDNSMDYLTNPHINSVDVDSENTNDAADNDVADNNAIDSENTNNEIDNNTIDNNEIVNTLATIIHIIKYQYNDLYDDKGINSIYVSCRDGFNNNAIKTLVMNCDDFREYREERLRIKQKLKKLKREKFGSADENFTLPFGFLYSAQYELFNEIIYYEVKWVTLKYFLKKYDYVNKSAIYSILKLSDQYKSTEDKKIKLRNNSSLLMRFRHESNDPMKKPKNSILSFKPKY